MASLHKIRPTAHIENCPQDKPSLDQLSMKHHGKPSND